MIKLTHKTPGKGFGRKQFAQKKSIIFKNAPIKKKRGESICLLDCTMKKGLENQQLKAKIVTEKKF